MKLRAVAMTTFMVTALGLFSACQSSLRPISERPRLGGGRADQAWIVVAAPFSFRHGIGTYTLPAGRYAPALEDDSGVYFRAPAEIVAADPLSATSLYSGGLYIPLDGSGKADTYIVVRSQLRFIELPANFAYALVR